MTKKWYKMIFLIGFNFNFEGKTKHQINYQLVEEFVKPLTIKIRECKQKYKITEVYEHDMYSIPKEYKDIVEKLTKVKIVSMEQ